MDIVSLTRVSARSLVKIAIAVSIATSQLAQPAHASQADPRLTIVTEHWKSSTGACTVDLQHATVTGVPSDVKARIDAKLASLLAVQSTSAPLTQAKREAACAHAVADSASVGKAMGRAFASDETATWTTGLARGRWLSVRLHVSGFAVGDAHPSDAYIAATFDLDYGGYPVSRTGFYTRSQGPILSAKLAQSEITALRVQDPGGSRDADAMASLRKEIEQSQIDESQILLTSTGLEVTDAVDAEAFRNNVIKLSYADLRGIGTPGGPLDPATRKCGSARAHLPKEPFCTGTHPRA